MVSDAKFPKIWVGFVFAALFLIGEVIIAKINPGSAGKPSAVSLILSLAGVAYWFFCIFKVHKILAHVTENTYPISPGKAVGYSFIPFFNIYWIFKWPAEIVNFVNTITHTNRMKNWLPGLGLFFSGIAFRVDGTLGFIMEFAILLYLVRTMQHVLATINAPIQHYKSSYKSSVADTIAACLIIFSVIALLAAIAVPAILRARIVANDVFAEKTVRSISKSIETYAAMNRGAYPSGENELKKIVTSYASEPFNNRIIQGYRYSARFYKKGYEVIAEPVRAGSTGTKIFKATTGGAISERRYAPVQK